MRCNDDAPNCDVGDLKGEHSPVIAALGGSVLKLGRGQGCLNVLDPGSAMAAARRLAGQARQRLTADVLGRRLNALAALISLNRRGPVAEQNAGGAIRVIQNVRQHLRTDYQHALGHAALDKSLSDRHAINEARAGRGNIKRRNVSGGNAQFVLQHAGR